LQQQFFTHQQKLAKSSAAFLAYALTVGLSPLSEDDSKGLKVLQAHESLKHPLASYLLGIYYECGYAGLKKDYAKAFSYYKEGADSGNDDCIGKVVCYYAQGVGVKKDLAKALQYARKGEALEEPESLLFLVNAYMNGIQGLIKPDKVQFAKYLVRAARAGHADAIRILNSGMEGMATLLGNAGISYV
jgi:TPR repeat protein